MKEIDAHEVARQVTLALVLEPIAEKDGCTTRNVDLDETIRLQHLQAAAVNINRYFYELTVRVDEHKSQPALYFDLAFAATKASITNLQQNGAKYINQGLITTLFHVVLSSLLTNGDGSAVCSTVPSILRQSSAEDAAYRNKLLRLVWSSSKSEKKRSFPDIEAANLYDFYEKLGTLSATHDYESGVLWTNELLSGLPIVQTMYTEANKHLEEGILAALEKSYEIGSSLLPIRSPGFIADYTGIVAYLLLRENPGKKIIL